MTLSRWQATVQTDTGLAVVSPSVTVRNYPSLTLADIYDDAGVAKSNPFTGSTEGFASFQAYPGRYLIEGVKGGQEAPDWIVDIGGDEFTTRAQAVTACADGWRANNGSVYDIGGYQYIGSTGATAISGLPGLLPHGRVTPKHFGASGGADLVAKTGLDDSAAFDDMLAYCHANNINPLIDDYHNLLSAPFQTQGVRLDGIVMEGTARGNSGIRVRIGDPTPQLSGTYSQAGTNTITVTIANHGMTTGDFIFLNFTSGTGLADTWAEDGWFYITVTGDNTFTCVSPEVRTNSGNCERWAFPEYCAAVILEGIGAGVRNMEIMAHQFTPRGSDRGHLGANILTGDFIYGMTGPEAMGFVVDDVRLTRAVDDVIDRSYIGAAVANMGNSHSSLGEIRAEIDGTVGVNFSYGQLAHWGCSGTDPRANPGETYHPHSIRFAPIGAMKGVTIGVGWSSCYDMDCPSLVMEGGRHAFTHLPGDNADAYAIPRDAGKICQGQRIGAIVATLDAARADEGDSGIAINCQAGSKWEASPAGDGGELLRQVPTDLTIGSIGIYYDGTCPDNTDAINLAHISGAIRLGQITAKGYSRRALLASGGGNSYLSYNVVNSDQNIYIFAVDKVDADGNAVEVGYSDETGALTFLGSELTATLGATVTAGATSCTLSAGISDIVYPGNTIMVGTDEVIATAVTPAGGVTLYHTPVLAGASSGAAVTVERRMKVRAQPDVRGGRFGVRVQLAEAMFWGKGPVNTGQHGYQIETGAVVTMQGAWPQATGENSATSTNYDLRILAGGHAEVYGANIGPGAATLEHHILVEAGGSLIGPNGVYRGSRPVLSGAFADYTPGRLVDASGVLVLPVPDVGVWTPTLNIGGSTAGITYDTTRQGHYVVHGRLVYCAFDFILTSKGSNTGSITLTGLPFTQATLDDVFANVGITNGTLASTSVSLRFQGNTATFQKQTDTNINNLDVTEIGNTSRIIGSFTYIRSV